MTRTKIACAGAALLLLAACGSQSDAERAGAREGDAVPQPAAVPEPATVATAPPRANPPPPPPPAETRPPLIGEAIARAEWMKADNRDSCAPLALSGDGGAGGRARRAQFGGGWGVAFDLPDLRSAYGVAGTGLLQADRDPPDAQRERLAKQWPHVRDLARLPQPAFAAYGLMGAEAYPAGNREGTGLHSLAYVRVGGQACTYNVWSRISRTHLETLLDNLRLVPRG